MMAKDVLNKNSLPESQERIINAVINGEYKQSKITAIPNNFYFYLNLFNICLCIISLYTECTHFNSLGAFGIPNSTWIIVELAILALSIHYVFKFYTHDEIILRIIDQIETLGTEFHDLAFKLRFGEKGEPE